MKLYLVEAPIKNAEKPYWARTWARSQGDAATARSRYTKDLGVARKDIRTTAVEVGTTRDELVPFINKISNTTDDYLYDGD